MRALDALSGLIEKLKAIAGSSRTNDFTCGDCDRWERCGQKPSEKCIARAAQIESERGRPPRNWLPTEY